MRRNYRLVYLVLVGLFFISDGQAQERKVNWNAFSVNLIKAIKSNHPGLQQSAMQQIIRYSDSLNVAPAVYTIGQIFRFDDDQQMRRLAMIALSKINTDKSLAILCRYVKFEENESIRKQCCLIVSDYHAARALATGKDMAAISTRNNH